MSTKERYHYRTFSYLLYSSTVHKILHFRMLKATVLKIDLTLYMSSGGKKIVNAP